MDMQLMSAETVAAGATSTANFFYGRQSLHKFKKNVPITPQKNSFSHTKNYFNTLSMATFEIWIEEPFYTNKAC